MSSIDGLPAAAAQAVDKAHGFKVATRKAIVRRQL